MNTILSFLLGVTVAEFGDLCPWLAARLVRWSARQLGDAQARERYEEEYLACLDAVPGKVPKLLAALGFVANVFRMRWALRADSRAGAEPIERSAQDAPGGFIALL